MNLKSRLLIGAFILLSAGLAQAQLTKRVLFIGNSYTARNALAETVRQLALSAGDTLIYDVHSPGGQRFQDHATNPTVYSKMRAQDWDYVVLQGQSQEPSWPDLQVNAQVKPYVNQLVDSIYAITKCAIPMFYMTWGRKNGDAFNCASWPPVCTYLGMDSILRKNYLDFAISRDGEASPVGAVWRQIREDYPSIELYTPDESHPSIAGTYAAAATFYASIFHKDPTLCSFITVDTATAGQIKRTARDVVLDSLLRWNIKEYEEFDSIQYSFRSNQNGGLDIVLKQPLIRYAEFTWIKDGGEAKGSSYPATEEWFSYDDYMNGHQIVVRIKYCDTLILDTVQVIHSFGSVDEMSPSIQIYPNPTTHLLSILPLRWQRVAIYDSHGQLLIKKEEFVSQLDVSHLSPGIYFLLIEYDDKLLPAKFVKR